MPQSSAPTPEFRRHHDVEAPKIDRATRREAWQVRSRLFQLAAMKPEAGGISAEECRAGIRYRDDYDVGIEGVSLGGGGPRVDNGGSFAGMTDARMGAIRRIDAAEAVLPGDVRLLRALVVDDADWATIGRLIGVHRDTAKRRCQAALGRLLAHYDRVDQLHRQGSSRMRMIGSGIGEENYEKAVKAA